MTMSSGNGGYGAMFDVTAKPGRTLVVRTLDIHTDTLSDVQVEVYVVNGAYAPHSYDSEAWSLICKTTVRSDGNFQRTRLPERDFAKIAIPGGKLEGFTFLSVPRISDIVMSWLLVGGGGFEGVEEMTKQKISA